MARELQPALHDVGKLVDTSRLGVGSHDFHTKVNNVKVFCDGELRALGLALPDTPSWQGAIGHHLAPQDTDLFLLTLADHAASAVSRAYEDKEKQVRDEDGEGDERAVITTETVHKLWHPDGGQPLARISDVEGVQELIGFLRGDPSDEEYLKKYANLLRRRPEDLAKPNDVASLYTHSRLVGKLYRFFKRHVSVVRPTPPLALEFFGVSANSPGDAQNKWRVWLTFGEVYFPQEPARARDLNVFDHLATVMRDLARQDEVLFCVSNQFLAVLPPVGGDELEPSLEAFLQRALAEGFYARLEIGLVPLNVPKGEDDYEPSMYENPLPRVLHKRAQDAIEIRVQHQLRGIPEERRSRSKPELRSKREAAIEKQFPHTAVYTKLSDALGVSICEICQMEEGTVEWPKQYVLDAVSDELCDRCRVAVRETEWPPDPDLLCPICLRVLEERLGDRTGREVLGSRCYALRRKGVRLTKLRDWTEHGRDQVAWVRIVLDMPCLVESLDALYTDYVSDVAPSLMELGRPDLRMSVVAEFQWDYEEFLRRYNAAVTDHFGDADVERVFDTDVNDLLCVRLDQTRDLLCLLKLYQDLMCYPLSREDRRGWFFCNHKAHRRHAKPFFPAFVDLPHSPIQLLVTSSRAHYPFFQHWRQMERERGRGDVYLHVVGSGELRVSLRALEPMLQKAQYRHRRAFHTLAEIARLSQALARLRMHDRGDRQQKVYWQMRRDLLPLGLDYQSILTLVKIMGG